MTIEFTKTELTELTPKITVFGVGGAGGNAVNNMINMGLEGVDFVVANTDAQALAFSKAEQKVQLGANLTQGLGAGARPEVGRAAAEETIDLIREHLRGCHMTFITAGMGGGTGTGAGPIIAQTAREEGILTVGVVTKPFQFEGNRRMALAEQGIKELSQYVDTLIIIPNQNLFRIANEKTTFADAFAMADEVLHSGVRGITDLMVLPGLVNLDFADVRTVMSEMGKAMMGTGEAEGDNRALEAAEAAISNPLLDEVSMKGANGVLINITGGMDLTLFEVDEAANRIRSEVNPEANILVGSALNPELDGKMRVSVVATGIDSDGQPGREEPRKTYSFDSQPVIESDKSPQGSGTYDDSWDEPVAERKSLVETAMAATVREDIIAAEEAPLDLVDEVAQETEILLARLSDNIVQRSESMPGMPGTDGVNGAQEPAFPADDVFISEAPVMPQSPAKPLMQQADPFAEADMLNVPLAEKRKEKKTLLGFFGVGRKSAAAPRPAPAGQTDMHPEGPMLRPNPLLKNKPTPPRQKDRPLIADELPVETVSVEKKTDVREDDHLEIPAFLRRQAN